MQGLPFAEPDLSEVLHHLIVQLLILPEEPLFLLSDVVLEGAVDTFLHADLAAFQLASVGSDDVLP